MASMYGIDEISYIELYSIYKEMRSVFYFQIKTKAYLTRYAIWNQTFSAVVEGTATLHTRRFHMEGKEHFRKNRNTRFISSSPVMIAKNGIIVRRVVF